jgi:hypothetical protein
MFPEKFIMMDEEEISFLMESIHAKHLAQREEGGKRYDLYQTAKQYIEVIFDMTYKVYIKITMFKDENLLSPYNLSMQ